MQAADSKDPRKDPPPIPEMVGATSEPFYIGPGPVEISFDIHPTAGPGAPALQPQG